MSLTLQGRFAQPDGFELQVNLELPGSGVTCIIGASGSGKSTLLRLIAGLSRKPDFQVGLNGQDWSALPAHRRPISMTLQQPALFPHLTVEANLRAVPGGCRFEEATNRFGLQGLLGRKPQRFPEANSSG